MEILDFTKGNAIGVTGVAPQASLVGLRLIAGSITAKEKAEALAWRSDIIDIKSNSWGWHDSGDALYSLDPLVADALTDGTRNGRDGLGVIYVWAGGNGRQNGDYSNYEGYNNAPETISVGAVDSNKKQSYYSESGANVLVTNITLHGLMSCPWRALNLFFWDCLLIGNGFCHQ